MVIWTPCDKTKNSRKYILSHIEFQGWWLHLILQIQQIPSLATTPLETNNETQNKNEVVKEEESKRKGENMKNVRIK